MNVANDLLKTEENDGRWGQGESGGAGRTPGRKTSDKTNIFDDYKKLAETWVGFCFRKS